jgi:hypothetical protein
MEFKVLKFILQFWVHGGHIRGHVRGQVRGLFRPPEDAEPDSGRGPRGSGGQVLRHQQVPFQIKLFRDEKHLNFFY